MFQISILFFKAKIKEGKKNLAFLCWEIELTKLVLVMGEKVQEGLKCKSCPVVMANCRTPTLNNTRAMQRCLSLAVWASKSIYSTLHYSVQIRHITREQGSTCWGWSLSLCTLWVIFPVEIHHYPWCLEWWFALRQPVTILLEFKSWYWFMFQKVLITSHFTLHGDRVRNESNTIRFFRRID